MTDQAGRGGDQQLEAERQRIAVSRGTKAILRPLVQGDYELLYFAEQVEGRSLFRQQGLTTPPEHYSSSLWAAVLAQYLVCRVDDLAPVGLATAYRADHRNGHAYIAGLVFAGFRRSGVVAEGFGLFLDLLFDTFPFRKLYAEVLEPNLPQFASTVGRLFSEEGRLAQHVYMDGHYVDLVTVSVSRESWTLHRAQGAAGLATFLREREAALGKGQSRC